ncbi:MAG: hypothetical protein PVH61_34345 [Candidatus Aminicenantes bacterium]|jgi:hypothetical protein
MRPGEDNIELLIQDINQRVENLKVQFNLFFTGEIRIPPEKEREELENRIRNLMSKGHKSPRVNLLIQNLGSRFSLYNNLWLKRLKELETGVSVIKRKKTAYMEEHKPPPPKVKPINVDISLNHEESFEQFFDHYSRMSSTNAKKSIDKEQIINSVKSKLITENMVDAQVKLTLKNGKVKIKIKPVQ